MSSELLEINARNLLSYSYFDIVDKLPPYVNVRYECGAVAKTGRKALAYSRFFWKFHERYPDLPISYSHHAQSVLKGGMMNSGTHVKLIEKIMEEVVFLKGFMEPIQKEPLLLIIYEIVQDLANDLPKLSLEYLANIDILDIIQIEDDPVIQKMKAETLPNSGSIFDFYSKAHKHMNDAYKNSGNSLTQYIRMGVLNMNQVNQCVLMRGLPIEVDGAILNIPIMSNYVTGMYDMYSYTAESRAAAKHLYSAETPLQESEYFARRLQLVTTVVEGIKYYDCGSNIFFPWLVKPPTFTTSGRQIYAGDLKYLVGKYYKTDKGLETIKGNETHLYNTVIEFRTHLYCKEPNPHYVCSTCFGGLSHNVSRFANLGHLCSATATQQTTQSILGTKHHIGSGNGSDIMLSEDGRRYLRFNENYMSFQFKDGLDMSKLKVVVRRESVVGLNDLRLITNIDNVTPRRISEIASIEITEEMPNKFVIPTNINIKQNSQSGFFTMQFLKFAITNKWETDEYGNFIFSLKGWNPQTPFIRMPDMEYSYSDHSNQIALMIESNKKMSRDRFHRDAPMQTTVKLFDLMNSKLNVNVAIIETIMYAYMIPAVNDYSMARNVEDPILGIAEDIIKNRSLGPAYSYEDQAAILTDPKSFFLNNRPSSPLDVLMTPREVVQYESH